MGRNAGGLLELCYKCVTHGQYRLILCSPLRRHFLGMKLFFTIDTGKKACQCKITTFWFAFCFGSALKQ